MINIWISELERTFKRKKTWVGLIVYILLLGFECLFLYMVGGQSFYDPDHVVKLNSLNTAPFFLRELGLFIIFVLLPMFVVDSFNGEYTSGAYRLVLLRPRGRAALFAVKWGVQAAIIFCLLCITWFVAAIYGHLVFPEVNEVSFLNTGELQSSEAFIYVLTFYSIALLVLLAVLTIGSLISTVMPNVILSYIGVIGFFIGGMYISDHFSFFITFTDSIFQVLGKQNMTLIPLAFSIVLISAILNIMIWTKRDWMG